MKQIWPAPERNKAPILEVLVRVFPASGEALEVASGSGQHAVHFASALPAWRWQPSDVDETNLASIRAWVGEASLANLSPPIHLDVRDDDWGIGRPDAIFCANMIHIAPWPCARGLLAGAGRYLKVDGQLVLYGPYRVDGAHTAPSNDAFDAGLKARDPSWGVRDLEAVVEVAAGCGLEFLERVPMPANNQILVFRRV
jgi:hypothetical protein